MNAIKKAKILFLVILAFTAIITSCTSNWNKSDPDSHFGTAINHPKFKGPVDFFKSLGRVGKIFIFKRLDGHSVLRPWIDTDGWLTPAFREQLCLVVTLNNHCVGWHKMHSQLGRDAGLTKEDMARLVELNPKYYDAKTWVALAWAKDWTLFRGQMPDEELVKKFESLYTERERRDILATVTAMDFSNRFMNMITGDVLDVEAAYSNHNPDNNKATPNKKAE